jgi:hypothetical protein
VENEKFGIRIKKHRLDNKCSEKFKMCIKNAGMTHELVPPNCHHCSIAERAIQTFKNHFMSILSGVDNRFPLSLWCHLVCPAKLTVNLLRQSNVTPKVSAYAHVHGQDNYMMWPFAPLGCAVMAHVKPKNRQTWDVHAEVGFNIGTAMEHHRCFHVYIVKTRATRVSNAVFFKHQYITNPQIKPETLVMKAAAELTSALKGTISCDAETAEALTKAGKLFQKIAAAKAATAKAKEQRNQHRTHPTARRAVPLPRVVNDPPVPPVVPLPRVPASPTVEDCCIGGVGSGMQNVNTLSQPLDSRLQIVENVTQQQGKHRPPSARPNYILQDDNAKQHHRYNTWLWTTSIMQEVMLVCIDITNPKFELLAAKLSSQRIPMMWLCEMVNSVIGEQGELLEYQHLIANPKTRATWTHLYGNELGRLTQGMPGQTKGMDTIFFIPWHKVPKERAKDVTYDLITCLVRPKKIEEPNRTRLVAGGDRVHYLFNAGTPTANLLTVAQDSSQ